MMENPIASPHSQPFDEEAEVADFLPPELTLEGRTTLSGDWRLEYLDQLHMTMEDPRFLTMPPSAQLLYLHFLKKSHGIGNQEVRISVDRLVADSKLAWMTVQKHLKTLATVGLLTMSLPSRQRVASTYLVHWFPELEKRQELKEIATRYDQLDQEDLAELRRLTPLLTAQERDEMSSDIHINFRADGLIPSPELVRKILHYRLLTTYPYKRKLAEKHPEWFNLP